MHPALYSWREQLPATLVRLLAYLGGITVLSIGAAHIFQSRPAIDPINAAARPQWVEIEKPFAAFVLAIPEAAGVPSHYTILRNRTGAGRKDILSLGEPDGAARRKRVARNTVYVEAGRPSAIWLPILSV